MAPTAQQSHRPAEARKKKEDSVFGFLSAGFIYPKDAKSFSYKHLNTKKSSRISPDDCI